MTKIARIDTFTKAGRYVPRGGVLPEDEIDTDEGNTDNVLDVDVSEERVAVEVSALGPTGPNPVNPQQIPPDAEQTIEGYVQNGARLVGEVTQSAEKRLVEIVDEDDTTQGDVVDALQEAERKQGGRGAETGNPDDDLVSGSVAEVTADLGSKSDEELQAIRDAEDDREAPRKGVISAIDKELASRQ